MTLNRLFLICLASISLVWVALYVADVSNRAGDKAFYSQKVAPHMSSGTAFVEGGPMDQWLERSRSRRENAMTRDSLFIGGMVLFIVWTAGSVIKGEIFWKKRNAAARVADQNAGAAIAALLQCGETFIARTGGRHFIRSAPREVEINPASETIVFRGFTFITSFIGNRRTAQMLLRFQDILGGRIWLNHGRYSLSLRTTAGKVTITDEVRPFHELAGLLLDVAEVSRSVLDRYAAALAREPHIKTPWYGWLIVTAALAGVGGLAIFLWNLPVK